MKHGLPAGDGAIHPKLMCYRQCNSCIYPRHRGQRRCRGNIGTADIKQRQPPRPKLNGQASIRLNRQIPKTRQILHQPAGRLAQLNIQGAGSVAVGIEHENKLLPA